MEVILNEQQFKALTNGMITQLANEADRDATEAQKKAGNYKMGHIRIGGFNITIENPKGSVRTFKNPDGSTDGITMKHHYGYFTKSKGKDGDAVDVFVGTYLDFDKIFVVDQYINGEFDESKVMLGFRNEDEAKQAYLSNFDENWKGFKKITTVSIELFKKWLYRGRKQRIPFYQYVEIKKKKLNEGKLKLDKYYTPDSEVNKCITLFQKTAKENNWNITEYIEPSAGNGAFSSKLNNCMAFDIKPESEGIQQADFLSLELPYKEGRCVIGNPPYGNKGDFFKKFLKKASLIGDYIAFVLPLSQLNNNHALPSFNLVKSVSLGNVLYSENKNVGTCFNIYARPQEGDSKPKNKRENLNDVTIIRNDNPKYKTMDYDIRMGAWGNSIAGRILKPEERQYAAEFKIKVNNPEVKNKVINVLQNANWREETNSYAMLKIQKFHIINLLKREIPEIS